MSTDSNNIRNIPPPHKPPPANTQFTPIQIGMGLMILGASAGLTLYTKKTQSMLQHMDKLNKAHAVRVAAQRKKQGYGPMTKQEYEKTRTRIDDDDLL